tara:strand:- start:6971 stop:7510 length:540 start_codon:yes stop_codon:yes gene_type:complete
MKDKILNLRSQGKTYSEIVKELGCSKSTVSYHCGKGQKEKHIKRQEDRYKKLPLTKRIEKFKNRKTYYKLRDFGRRVHSPVNKGLNPTSDNKFTYDDVLDKIGDSPICYLTGDPIDITNQQSFEFDHIIPISQGGHNDLDNLGLCTRDANRSKAHMTYDEYIEHCRKVLENLGYTVSKN